jgi:hypothetical protein
MGAHCSLRHERSSNFSLFVALNRSRQRLAFP